MSEQWTWSRKVKSDRSTGHWYDLTVQSSSLGNTFQMRFRRFSEIRFLNRGEKGDFRLVRVFWPVCTLGIAGPEFPHWPVKKVSRKFFEPEKCDG